MLAGSGDPNRPGAIEQFTIGTPERVLDDVRALVRTGLDDVIFNIPGLRDPAQLTRVAALLREACE